MAVPKRRLGWVAVVSGKPILYRKLRARYVKSCATLATLKRHPANLRRPSDA